MLPRTIFDEDHEIFRNQCRRFFENEVVPHHEAWEELGQVPREVWEKAGQAGLLAVTVPEKWGGAGADFRYAAIVAEEQARTGCTGPGFSIHSDIIVPYVTNYGSDEQREYWLPRLVDGRAISAIAMTEPGAGSDLQGVRTTAHRDGDDYIINGQKTFISNGQMADLIIVVAKTDPERGARGTSLFLVEADREGFQRGRNLKKVGMKAQDTSELFFDNVRVPASNLLGKPNEGFIYLMQELAQERLSIAVMAIAGAEAALEWTISYVKERHAFGKPLAKLQNTRFKIADMVAEVQATRCFIDRCIEEHSEGRLTVATAAAAKLQATEAQSRVNDTCLQLFGGYGYMWEYPIARAWADARIQRIYGGASEIMRELVARATLD